ncbi:FAD-dependent oxidoreductase [Microbacterium fluvii]|uniref:FAD-dependent oxidoreductase n=1 Tax=Microbacterium fluvii TaxID=415215 RepID=A0ABW2HBF5_9MICO|nr:FAD-dependent monooxygenase [Microbacterium fluvii]MCU4672296.1 FAD-dependent monooxygenase [Microbacterium fluvii]
MKTEELRTLRIAIVGGGYGGAAAAVALRHAGAQNVHVYEQAAALAPIGAGIGIRPPAVELFRTWGIWDEIAKVSGASDHLEILTADGTMVLAQEEWPGLNDYAQPNHNRIIHRGDFIDVLLGALPADSVHLGHRLESIVDDGATATLRFANGEVVEADLVIAADGIRSVVRHALFSQKPPVFAHEHAYRIVVPIDQSHGLVSDANPRFYIGRDGVIAYNLPLAYRGELSYDITAPSDDDTWAPEISNDYLVSLLDGFDERIVAVARELDIDQVTSRSVYDIDAVDTWHTDSVALLGDAAHAMLHHQGWGANSAILDAEGLATALVAADTVSEALAAYQAVRKPMTDHLQAISRQGWNGEQVESAFPANA